MSDTNISDTFFHITSQERAIFEAGIKLGGLYHQFTGTPVSMESAENLERAIEDALRAQPFVKAINVKIDREMLRERCGEGSGEMGEGYTILGGEMLEVNLSVAFQDKMAVCGMRYVREIDYPLMYVNRIEEICWEGTCPSIAHIDYQSVESKDDEGV